GIPGSNPAQDLVAEPKNLAGRIPERKYGKGAPLLCCGTVQLFALVAGFSRALVCRTRQQSLDESLEIPPEGERIAEVKRHRRNHGKDRLDDHGPRAWIDVGKGTGRPYQCAQQSSLEKTWRRLVHPCPLPTRQGFPKGFIMVT